MMFWAKVKIVATVAAVVTVVGAGGGAVAAGEPAKPETPAAPPPAKVERKGPLAGLPSAPGPHIEKIKAMGDDTWLDLGSPAPDPKWGDAVGRAYSYKMAYAEDMRGAFLYGEGVHGATFNRNGKPHYNDDLFLYDINGHRWVCAYPGFEIGTYSAAVTVDKDGFEATKDGPLPIAAICHGYGNLAYDPVNKTFMSMQGEAGGGYYAQSMPERAAFRQANGAKLTGLGNASPWMFDTLAGHWTAKKTGMENPPLGHCGHLYYIPSKQAMFWNNGTSETVAYYDPAKNAWRKIQVKRPRQLGSYDTVSCYDTKRNRIYFPGASKQGPDGKIAHDLMAYDLATDAWLDLNPKGDVALAFQSRENSSVASAQYDSANDVALIFSFGHQPSFAGRSVVAYSPEKNELTLATKKIADAGLGWPMHNCFYDPELNAHFVFTAGDSQPGGKMFVYRYKRAPEKK